MRRPLLPLSGILGLAVLLSLLAPRESHALTYRKLTDTDVKTTVAQILSLAKANDDTDDFKSTLELASKVRAIVELTDARCPMPLKVINGTSGPLFNVKVSVSERRASGTTRTPTVLHIPYIPAKSYVSGTVRCALTKDVFAYRYGAAGGDTYLSASPIGEHSRLDDDGIAEMSRVKEDTTTSTSEFAFTTPAAASDSITTGDDKLDEILNRNIGRRDAGAARTTVLGRTDAGTTALGRTDAGAARGAASATATSAAAAAGDRVEHSMVQAALSAIENEADFKLFAAALLRSTPGARELGVFVRRFPGRPFLSTVVPMLANATPAKVGLVLEEAMRDDDRRSAALLSAAAARVCGPGQAEDVRASTWLAALAPDVRNAAAREAILAKCGVSKEQTKARLKAAKGVELGRALDGMQGELFEAAVGAMVEAKSAKAASTLLADTQNNDKFEAVAKAAATFVTSSAQKQELLRTVANGKSGLLDETKATWLAARLDDLHGQGADEPLLRHLFADMASGSIGNEKIRTAVFARRKEAGKGALDPFVLALKQRSHVLVPSWVIAKAEAGQIDLVDLLGKLGPSTGSATAATSDPDDDTEASGSGSGSASHGMGGVTYGSAGRGTASGACTAGAERAAACLAAVRHLPLTSEAIDPAFVTAAIGFVADQPRNSVAIRVVTDLKQLGVDVSRVVDALCSAATIEPGRYGYGSGASDPLTSAEALGADNACVGRVRAARASAERWIVAGIGLRLALVLVPFGFVALFVRRRFVPVRAQLAKENAELEAVRGKAIVTTRLEGKRWDDAMNGGLADAARFLESSEWVDAAEIAGVGRALAALSAETRASLVERTRGLATRAVETGAVTTCLCELEGIVLYVVFFPGKDDQPQTVRRHPAFAKGWPSHIESIVDACVADGRPKRVLSLVVMLGTDGARGTMLVAYDSAEIHLLPEGLADGIARADRETRTHGHRYETSVPSPAASAAAITATG